MDLGLEGRVALVTGASKGIGRAIAAALVGEGARVALASRSAERAAAASEAVGGAGGFAWDSGDPDGAPALLEAVEASLGGPVEVLVVNTGGPPAGPDALGLPREQWEDAYRSLVLGPMALVQAAVPGMRARGWGRVVNVASTSVREPLPALVLSNSHRAAMVLAFKTIARQVAADGVTLNTILPGRIDTDRLAELFGSREAAQAQAGAEVPAGRLGSVEEFAAVATFLCSAQASYVTGETVAVDGGLTRSV